MPRRLDWNPKTRLAQSRCCNHITTTAPILLVDDCVPDRPQPQWLLSTEPPCSSGPSCLLSVSWPTSTHRNPHTQSRISRISPQDSSSLMTSRYVPFYRLFKRVLTMWLQSLLYHDVVEGDVHVSHDEGKTWNRADDIPRGKAAMLIEHPFDNSYVSS